MDPVQFNPNSPAVNSSGIFGLPSTAENAQIILIPVNWEVTVSYGSGASLGSEAIRTASMQLDLCNHDFPDLWKKGIWLDEFPKELQELNIRLKEKATGIIESLQAGEEKSAEEYREIDDAGEKLNAWVKERVSYWKKKNKIVGLIGGDHSIPLGYLQYLNEQHSGFGLLVVDAHLDLRKSYEGFTYSHASIFYNALLLENISKLVQVGIRDYCHEEIDFVRNQKDRVSVFFDRDNRKKMFEGYTWQQIVNQITNSLPEKVYISIDIDGLDPKNCPHTGTPVPGGLQFEELIYLFNQIKSSGREILGFDLCEVAPGDDEWDGNVGARVLYHLCGLPS